MCFANPTLKIKLIISWSLFNKLKKNQELVRPLNASQPQQLECCSHVCVFFFVCSEMQEILKSLVAAPLDGGDMGQESGPTPYHPDPALKTHPMLPMQFHSFDRSVPVSVWPTRDSWLIHQLIDFSSYYCIGVHCYFSYITKLCGW